MPLPAINCWYICQLEDTDAIAPGVQPQAQGAVAATSAPGATGLSLPLPSSVLEEEPDYFAADAEPSMAAAPAAPVEPQPEAQGAAPDATASNSVVHASWLMPPAALTWNTQRVLTKAEAKQSLDAPFMADGAAPPPALWSTVQHWVRPSLLAAVLVRESGQVTLWWAAMSTRYAV